MAQTGQVQAYPIEWYERVKGLYEEHQEKLSEYIELLLWWNNKINLISRSINKEELACHVEHSLLSYPLLDNDQTVWDLGTGGGLPGIPLAIVNPNCRLILNDSVNKKIMASKNICKKMGLEQVAFTKGDFRKMAYQEGDLAVTKHAFSLDDFFSARGVDQLKKVVFYKGYPVEEKNADQIIRDKKCTIYTLEHLGSFYEGKALYVCNH